MARMTDKEADTLDEYYTQNTIMPKSGKPGVFVRHTVNTPLIKELTTELHGEDRTSNKNSV
jgi:hypothetical protein